VGEHADPAAHARPCRIEGRSGLPEVDEGLLNGVLRQFAVLEHLKGEPSGELGVAAVEYRHSRRIAVGGPGEGVDIVIRAKVSLFHRETDQVDRPVVTVL
jgi:hypothetical protein